MEPHFFSTPCDRKRVKDQISKGQEVGKTKNPPYLSTRPVPSSPSTQRGGQYHNALYKKSLLKGLSSASEAGMRDLWRCCIAGYSWLRTGKPISQAQNCHCQRRTEKERTSINIFPFWFQVFSSITPNWGLDGLEPGLVLWFPMEWVPEFFGLRNLSVL